jgi:glycosyltransferase involved in cell wall biosynthesis
VPTLATSACPVKRGHSLRAGAGFVYKDPGDFAQTLQRLLSSPDARKRSARAGADYVRERYGWPRVTERFLKLAQDVASSSR